MKVRLAKTLGAKLFYLMTTLVLITVAGSALQYSLTLKRYLTAQVQDSLLMQAEKAANQVEAVLDGWRSQVAVVLPTVIRGGTAAQDLGDQIQKFVNSSSEYISLQIFEAPSLNSSDFTPIGAAFTASTHDQRFEDSDPDRIWQRTRVINKSWLAENIGAFKKTKFTVTSLSQNLKLPIIATIVRFDVANSKKVVWAILTTWQSELIKAMPKSDFVDSHIIDDNGRILSSPLLSDMLGKRSLKSLPLALKAIGAAAPSGFVDEYRGINQKIKLGSYARLQKLDLSVLVERDADQAFQAVKEHLFSVTLWAVLFILIAVMFSFLGAAGITKSLRDVAYATERIAAGDFNYRIQPKSEDEVATLGLAVNHMSRRIVQLMQTQVEKARFEKELETAKIVQSTFFPKKNVQTPNLSITGFYQPASECGGDLWGHFTISEHLEFLFIADAMGHGAPAALVTAMAFSTCMTIADIFKEKDSYNDSPAKILERMNRIIYDAVEGTISMTCFAAVIDTKHGMITFANAGHNLPILLAANADDSRASKSSKNKNKSASGYASIPLKLRGTPMGMYHNTTYTENQIELKAGDKIFLFTDGLIECTSPSGSAWGRKLLLDHVTEVAAQDAETIKQNIVKRAFDFFGKKPIADDVTVVVAEISKHWQATPALSVTGAKQAEPINVNLKSPSPSSAQPPATLTNTSPREPYRVPLATDVALEIPAMESVQECAISKNSGENPREDQGCLNLLDKGVTTLTFNLALLDDKQGGTPLDLAPPPVTKPETAPTADLPSITADDLAPRPAVGKYKIKLPKVV